ncbi:MAG TPA: cupin domain-containing protein [Nitrosopumilus sp.]|jgi:mannose-6-phosphate isomerase-like protein (cupin superfamily)|nr:cupin domain-containing protein [Nitrosopumilus sp.]
MSIKENSKIEFFKGNEGASVKQIFNPQNTTNEITYSLAQFSLEPNKKTKLHKIKSSEIYYILKGKGKLKIDSSEFDLKKDDSVYVPPNSKQCIENTGTENLYFLCIVEPAWKAKDEKILE